MLLGCTVANESFRARTFCAKDLWPPGPQSPHTAATPSVSFRLENSKVPLLRILLLDLFNCFVLAICLSSCGYIAHRIDDVRIHNWWIGGIAP